MTVQAALETPVVDTFAAVRTPPQYQFVVDADLVHVGGGSAVIDY